MTSWGWKRCTNIKVPVFVWNIQLECKSVCSKLLFFYFLCVFLLYLSSPLACHIFIQSVLIFRGAEPLPLPLFPQRGKRKKVPSISQSCTQASQNRNLSLLQPVFLWKPPDLNSHVSKQEWRHSLRCGAVEWRGILAACCWLHYVAVKRQTHTRFHNPEAVYDVLLADGAW